MLTRRSILLAAAFLLGSPSAFAQTPAKGDPLFLGVSGPLTGQYAQYGAQWKKGFDLAIELANAQGGVKGRPVQYVFEDSQSDPRQSFNAVLAQIPRHPEFLPAPEMTVR